LPALPRMSPTFCRPTGCRAWQRGQVASSLRRLELRVVRSNPARVWGGNFQQGMVAPCPWASPCLNIFEYWSAATTYVIRSQPWRFGYIAFASGAEEPGSNPAKLLGKRKHSYPVLYSWLKMHFCTLKRRNTGIGQKTLKAQTNLLAMWALNGMGRVETLLPFAKGFLGFADVVQVVRD
jgi:hypothetical protein